MIQKIINDENNSEIDHHSDCHRIQEVLLRNGYTSTLKDCYDLWSDYSYSYAAGWLYLPEEDEELWNTIQYRINL